MMSRYVVVAAAAVAVVALASTGASAYQMRRNPGKMCSFNVNGTSFDFSKVYDWPVTVIAGKYTYTFDPCNPLPSGVACHETATAENRTTPHGTAPQLAMCQVWDAGMWATGGLLEPFATWNGNYPGSTTGKNSVAEINFPYGDAWRNTKLTVMETESENTTLAFISEEPEMQYNFVLAGKHVFHIAPFQQQ